MELRIFLWMCSCAKKVLFYKSFCQTSGSVSGMLGHLEVPDGSVKEKRVILIKLTTVWA